MHRNVFHDGDLRNRCNNCVNRSLRPTQVRHSADRVVNEIQFSSGDGSFDEMIARLGDRIQTLAQDYAQQLRFAILLNVKSLTSY